MPVQNEKKNPRFPRESVNIQIIVQYYSVYLFPSRFLYTLLVRFDFETLRANIFPNLLIYNLGRINFHEYILFRHSYLYFN